MIGCQKSIDTYLQDQHTRPLGFIFKRLLNAVTLSAPTIIDTYTISLTAGHNFVIGEYISIIENGIPYQSRVIGVDGNTITVDSPMDRVYTVNSLAARTTTNLNVNGAVTPLIYNINPVQNARWHINGLVIQITDDSAMDDGKFGGIAELTKGLIIRYKNNEQYNIATLRKNACFELSGWNVSYSDKAPSGLNGVTMKKIFNGQDNSGVTLYLDGRLNDELQIIIQDDLSALTTMKAYALGHEVLD
jgi:hypothetical protein